MISEVFLKKFKNVLTKHSVFEIIGHIRPDLDCWSAAASMSYFLKVFGKQVIFKCSMPSVGFVNRFKFKPASSKKSPEVCICVDCASRERLEFPVEANILVNIDHHKSNTRFGDLNLVVPDISSTCEILWWLFKKIGRSELWLTSRMAQFICLGILSDTNILQTSSVNSNTFLALTELAKKVIVFDIVRQLQAKHDFEGFKKVVKASAKINNGIVFFLPKSENFK